MFTHVIDIIDYTTTTVGEQEHVVDSIKWQLTSTSDIGTEITEYTTLLSIDNIDDNFKSLNFTNKDDFINWIKKEVDIDQIESTVEINIQNSLPGPQPGPAIPTGNQ